MASPSHEDNMFNIQRQMVRNQKDLSDYLADLGSWEDEMKKKEQDLLKKKSNEPEASVLNSCLFIAHFSKVGRHNKI